MTEPENFNEVFKQLKAIFQAYARKLNVVADTTTDYSLETDHVLKNGHRLFFGAVRLGKAYASFHLMPVYACPELVKEMSPELKKRMQGKSCFNFKTVDKKLFKELGKLTKAGYQRFNDPKFLDKIFAR